MFEEEGTEYAEAKRPNSLWLYWSPEHGSNARSQGPSASHDYPGLYLEGNGSH